MIHDLKIERSYLLEIIEGRKTFEIRKNDRDYHIGDYLDLREYDAATCLYGSLNAVVYVTSSCSDERFVKDVFVVMSISLLAVLR